MIEVLKTNPKTNSAGAEDKPIWTGGQSGRRKFFTAAAALAAATLTASLSVEAKRVKGIEGQDYFNTKDGATEFIKGNKGKFQSYKPDTRNPQKNGFNREKIDDRFHDGDSGNKLLIGLAVKGLTKYGDNKWVIYNPDSYIYVKEDNNRTKYLMDECSNVIYDIEPVYEEVSATSIPDKTKPAPAQPPQVLEKLKEDWKGCPLTIRLNGREIKLELSKGKNENISKGENENIENQEYLYITYINKKGEKKWLLASGRNNTPTFNVTGIKTFKELMELIKENPQPIIDFLTHFKIANPPQVRQVQPIPILLTDHIIVPSGYNANVFHGTGYVIHNNVVYRNGQQVKKDGLDVFLDAILKIGFTGFVLKGLGY